MSDQAFAGEPRIPLSEPRLAGNEWRYLKDCLDTNYVSSVGRYVERFERAFADWVGAEHAVATCNGTAAIHVALKVAGVEPGDEVLVSDFTFIASVNPVRYLGAEPVLVDSEPESWNLDPELVLDELERRAERGCLPAAVMVVHIYGRPANIIPILEAARRFDVPVVEDAAESLGARIGERQVGTLGMLGCFSFNGNKVMTTGGGGMIVTDRPELADRARHLTTQARLPGPEYRHDEVGYNYRMTNVTAALGLAQLEQLAGFLESKRALAKRYREALGDLRGLQLPTDPPWGCSSWWLYSVLVEAEKFGMSRDEVVEALREQGIQSRPVWTPVHTFPMYRESRRLGGGIADELSERGLSLPSSVGLSAGDQDRSVRALRRLSTMSE